MKTLETLFGESPFEHLVIHSRKIHECVHLIRPIADAILEGNMDRLTELMDRMSNTEYEADKIKDDIRAHLPGRFFLAVQRHEVLDYLRQLDRMGDDCEDFAVVATFRRLEIPVELRKGFLDLVNKAVEAAEALVLLAEELAALERRSFMGEEAEKVLHKIKRVCHMEWECDKLSRAFARQYYGGSNLDAVTIILLEKLCRALTSLADHAENVGKDLRLMIAHG